MSQIPQMKPGEEDVELAAFGFAPTVLATLYNAGFRYPADLLDRSPRELANGLGIKDASSVINAVRKTQDRVVSLPPSALDLLKVRLIVIDSVAFHFRHGFEDYAQRARALDTTALLLQRLAAQHDIAIVIVNQVTSRTTFFSRTGLTDVPALGAFISRPGYCEDKLNASGN
ncbi:hypothetical protein ATCC90586_007492 [Pythium insidiosum]|nr:hypothetical protein ATCC90586_007492 [Pythium insidiosum]